MSPFAVRVLQALEVIIVGLILLAVLVYFFPIIFTGLIVKLIVAFIVIAGISIVLNWVPGPPLPF